MAVVIPSCFSSNSQSGWSKASDRRSNGIGRQGASTRGSLSYPSRASNRAVAAAHHRACARILN
jgi:hypothetical protein